MSQRPFSLRRLAAASAIVAGVLLCSATAASAHVTIQETDQKPDSYTVLTFGVPHGCDGSPTTKIRIKLPESIPTATPTVNPGWDINLVKEKLATPIDLGEGESLTERITEIQYTAKTPLPVEYRDALAVSVHIPKDAAGTTLQFPTIQECVKGQTDWTMIPKKGQDPFELATPAPFINVAKADAEASGDDTASTTTAASTTEAGSTSTTDGSSSSDSSKGIAIAGLIAGLIGIGVGGVALAATRKNAA